MDFYNKNAFFDSKVSVIVPFYQEKSGLLTRCLDSICKQQGVINIEVLIVNDGSPICPHQELKNFQATSNCQIKIIDQSNHGVAHARNSGLNNTSNDTEFIAFLDPDDCWYEQHLFNALSALDKGFDLYFADTYQYDSETETRFSQIKASSQKFWRNRKNVRLKSEILNLYAPHKETLKNRLITYPKDIGINTQTTVFRKSVYNDLRFNNSLHCWEDKTFFEDCSKHANNICFSTNIDAYKGGDGINISYKAKWDSHRGFLHKISALVYLKDRLKRLSQSNYSLAERNKVRQQIRQSRKELTLTTLHHLKKFQLSPSDMKKIIQYDAFSILYIPTFCLEKLRKKE